MKKFFSITIIILFCGCKPENVTISQVISNLKISNKTPLADGTTIVYLSAQLNNYTDADKRSIIFETSKGQFVPSNDTLHTQPAVFQNGNLVATIALQVPMTFGEFYVSAKPSVITPNQNFILNDSINALESVPASLKLTPSALAVETEFGSEIQLTALLKNSNNGNVSKGSKVMFQDYFPNGQPVNGEFRATRASTDATSTATTNYSVGNVSPYNTFYIKCTYINQAGQLTSITDACLITVIPIP